MADAKLLYSAFDLVTQPVIIVKKQLIAHMNPAARSLIRKDILGKPAALLFPSYIVNTQADNFATSAPIGDENFAVRVTSADGYRVYVLDPAEPGLDSSSRLFANTAAYLSNMMSGIRYMNSYSDMLKDEKFSSIYKSLSHSAYRLNRSFQNLATMRLLADGGLPFTPETLDITDLLRELTQSVRVLSDEKHLHISLNAEEHVRLNADKRLFEELMLNLFANSIAHCRENGRISVSVLRGDSHLIIGVVDDGDGISPDELSAVFKKYRTGIDLTKANDGDGMGLCIVKGIAEMHGGTIIIESRGKDMGTSVRVMLSYSTKARENFRTPLSDYSDNSMQNMLIQLSPCLSDDCYGAVFSD